MIENSIRDHALTHSEHASELTALIGNNLVLSTNHNAEHYVLLRVINDPTPIELHLEENQRDAQIQFDCYSPNPQKAQAIAKALETIFNTKGFKDESVDVQLALRQNRRPDFETDTSLYLESHEYVFYYNPITTNNTNA